jgi:hypothetical protein
MPSPVHGTSVSRAPDESIAPDNAICRHLIKLRTPIRDAPFRAHAAHEVYEALLTAGPRSLTSMPPGVLAEPTVPDQ